MSIAVFMLQWKYIVFTAETRRPVKPKIFTISLQKKKKKKISTLPF